MSGVYERSALDHPESLFKHAQRLHLLTPDGPLPDGGRRFPDSRDSPRTPYRDRQSALRTLFQAFIADKDLLGQDLHELCSHLTINSRDVTHVLQELAPEPFPRLLAAARWLIEYGTDRRAVLVGLGLLCGNAEPTDVQVIKMVGLLCFADQLAVETLARIPAAEHDLIWLADRSRRHARYTAVQELAGNPDPDVRRWVLATPRELLSSDLARRIAEGHRLEEQLSRGSVDDEIWDHVGNLLLAMTSTRNYQSEISRYERAHSAYEHWIAHAGHRQPSLDRAALLTMVAEDLLSGPAAPVVGNGRRTLVDEAKRVLRSRPWTEMLRGCARSGDPIEARRAAWVIDSTTSNDDLDHRFAIRIVVPDPNPVGFPQVEARVVIDGMPVVAAAFDKGPAAEPEWLVHGGRLRATNEPKEVRLAEAYCTEGCCGGLYVTIVREGPEVVWTNWRSSMRNDPPQEIRFDAAEYDREIERAEHDHGWEWPARTVARLIADELRADPSILGQWDCTPGWCTAWLQDFDTARLTFTYPVRRDSFNDPNVQFGLVVDVRDQTPESVTVEIIESVRNTDPKTSAEMIGGSKDGADRLGLVYRKPSRW